MFEDKTQPASVGADSGISYYAQRSNDHIYEGQY